MSTNPTLFDFTAVACAPVDFATVLLTAAGGGAEGLQKDLLTYLPCPRNSQHEKAATFCKGVICRLRILYLASLNMNLISGPHDVQFSQ